MSQKASAYFDEIGEIRNVSLKYTDSWDILYILYTYISHLNSFSLMYYTIKCHIYYIYIYIYIKGIRMCRARLAAYLQYRRTFLVCIL